MKPLRLMAWAIDTGEGYYTRLGAEMPRIYRSRELARYFLRDAKPNHPSARVVRISIRIEHG